MLARKSTEMVEGKQWRDSIRVAGACSPEAASGDPLVEFRKNLCHGEVRWTERNRVNS